MNQVIKIGETPLDLDSGTVISTSKRVANIGTLERQSSFTNKLNLPATANNLAAIGMVQGNDDSIKKYIKQSGSVLANGIEVMNAAQFSFESLSDRLEVLINSDNAVFYDAINKTNLRELDLSELDHVWNQVEIYNSRFNTYLQGYIYAINNTGNQSRNTNFLQCQGVIPSLFAKYLFEKIGETFGYTLTGSFWNTDFFSRLLIPIVNSRLGERNINELTLKASRTSPQVPGYIFNQWIFVSNFTLVTKLNGDPFTDPYNVFINNNIYVFRIPGVYEFRVDFTSVIKKAIPNVGETGTEAKVRIYATKKINGIETVIGEQIVVQDFSGEGDFNGSLSLIVNFEDIIFETEDPEVFCYVQMWQTQEFGPEMFPITNTLISLNTITWKVLRVSDAEFTHFNRIINLEESLPNWTCGKFIKEVCNLAGVIPIVDEASKSIRLMMINELEENKPIAKDWQSKIDLSNDPTYTFKIDGYAQRMDFRYAQDSLYGYFTSVLNESLPKETNYIKSDFNYSTPSRILNKSFNTVLFNLWDTETNYLKFDNLPRIALLFKANTPVVYTAPNETNVSYSSEIPFMSFQTQSFLNNSLEWTFLFESFYESLIQGVTNNILKIELDFRLTEFDIQDFDFSIPIYLENPSGFYYVQEIKDFTSSKESTSVELLRIG